MKELKSDSKYLLIFMDFHLILLCFFSNRILSSLRIQLSTLHFSNTYSFKQKIHVISYVYMKWMCVSVCQSEFYVMEVNFGYFFLSFWFLASERFCCFRSPSFCVVPFMKNQKKNFLEEIECEPKIVKFCVFRTEIWYDF